MANRHPNGVARRQQATVQHEAGTGPYAERSNAGHVRTPLPATDHHRRRHGGQRPSTIQIARQHIHQAFTPQRQRRVDDIERRDGDTIRVGRRRFATQHQDGQRPEYSDGHDQHRGDTAPQSRRR